MDLVKIAPEELQVVETYLTLDSNVANAANTLGIPRDRVQQIIARPHIKAYLKGVYMEQGYLNAGRLSSLLEEMIESKLEEARVDEVYTKADLLDLLKFAASLRRDLSKEDAPQTPSTQTNIQINTGYDKLLNRLLESDD